MVKIKIENASKHQMMFKLKVKSFPLKETSSSSSRSIMRCNKRQMNTSKQEILRLKSLNSRMVFNKKKLHLVLDLDHTLLHSKKITKLTEEERLAMNSPDTFVFNNEYLVKLRPFVRQFLEAANDMFEISVASMGTNNYVDQIVQFLDPQGKYFANRFISREGFGQREEKNLDLILGLEYGVVIVDDTESVWKNHSKNLMKIKRYEYFSSSYSNGGSYAELKTDESESDGELARVLRDLKRVHSWFFGNSKGVKDIRRCHLLPNLILLF